MTNNETPANPYQSPATDPPQAQAHAKALKYLAHGIYLQLFLGAGMLAISSIDVDTGRLFSGPFTSGLLLVVLGLNSLVYIHRYKKSLP